MAILPTAYLLDHTPVHVSFVVLSFMAFAFGVLSLAANVVLQVVAMLIFVVMRPLLYAAMNEFTAKTFGFKTLGKVYGLMAVAGGCFNLLQVRSI